MSIRPRAIGIEVVPTLDAALNCVTAVGHNQPAPTPTAIAEKIQRVRYRSRKESLAIIPFIVTPHFLIFH
jgi:hypothetical protein